MADVYGRGSRSLVSGSDFFNLRLNNACGILLPLAYIPDRHRCHQAAACSIDYSRDQSANHHDKSCDDKKMTGRNFSDWTIHVTLCFVWP